MKRFLHVPIDGEDLEEIVLHWAKEEYLAFKNELFIKDSDEYQDALLTIIRWTMPRSEFEVWYEDNH